MKREFCVTYSIGSSESLTYTTTYIETDELGLTKKIIERKLEKLSKFYKRMVAIVMIFETSLEIL